MLTTDTNVLTLLLSISQPPPTPEETVWLSGCQTLLHVANLSLCFVAGDGAHPQSTFLQKTTLPVVVVVTAAGNKARGKSLFGT